MIEPAVDSTGEPLRILTIHNSYRQRGGEDAVFEAESALLRDAGHTVETYHVHNRAIELDDKQSMSRWAQVALALRTVWSHASYRAIRAAVARFRPAVAHVHNTLPLISPSVYYALARAKVPVVQTVHNYRLLCPAATLYRDGAVCELCVERSPWAAVQHRCYRGSRGASAAVAAMLAAHRRAGTYQRRIDAYLALTEFGRQKLVQGGLPEDRIHIVPNFLGDDPGPPPGDQEREGILFVGRLTEEKGIQVLLEAVPLLDPRIRVRIAGTGPLLDRVRAASGASGRVEVLGEVSADEVRRLMRRSAILCVPSLWYEGLPMTLVEAWQNGLPALVTGIGALRELVDCSVGSRFRAADAAHLAMRANAMIADPAQLARLSETARRRYEERYSAAAHRQELVAVYRHVIAARADRTARGAVSTAVSSSPGSESLRTAELLDALRGPTDVVAAIEPRPGSASGAAARGTESDNGCGRR